VLTGLNYFKNKTDPVALADDAYPEWLWKCLEVTVKKTDEGDNADAEAEFCKSVVLPIFHAAIGTVRLHFCRPCRF
jgi:hypothetical protein